MKKMKFNLVGGVILALVFGTTLFTACSSDSDGGTSLSAPKYESTAAKYEIQNTNAAYQSIELTASGDYIITKRGYRYVRPVALTTNVVSKFLARPEAGTRATNGNIIYGKYTKISDTEYQLEGFGTIVITGSTDNAVSLQITETGGTPYTLTAAESNQAPESEMTRNLCRTWKIASFSMKVVVAGRTYLDGEYTYDKYGAWNMFNDMKNNGMLSEKDIEKFPSSPDQISDEDELELMEDAPLRVIFTKAGTYMVQYSGDRLAVATWSWKNEAEGEMRYSWNYDNMYTSGSGLVKIGFRGNQLTLRESGEFESSDISDEEGSVVLTWYMNEVQ